MNRANLVTLLVLSLLSILLSRAWSARAGVAQYDSSMAATLSPDGGGGNNPLYIPMVAKPLDAPAFDIISPGDGWTVSGMINFAVQVVDGRTIDSVTFFAGDHELGHDDTPGDGFKTLLNASDFPAGPLTLHADGYGPMGQVRKSIAVTVQPSPPSSAIIGEGGGVLASEIGSIITIPPGAVPTGTNISVDELTQEETTALHGLDWEAMGVTFLGAQEIDSDADFNTPIAVSSAGFGNRVQPGQVVVNYTVAPDANGDGIGELVVVNSASVAPNGDVLSDPVLGIQLGATTVTNASGSRTLPSPAAGISGPPGTLIEIEARGFNPLSAVGNVAVFHSLVDGTEEEDYGSVLSEALNPSQTLVFAIPLLQPGPATLTLVNASTKAVTGPYDITVEPHTELPGPTQEIIDEFFLESISAFTDLQAGFPEQVTDEVTKTIESLNIMRDAYADMATDSSPEVQSHLEEVASMIVDSAVMDHAPGALLSNAPAGEECITKSRRKFMYDYLKVTTGVGKFACRRLLRVPKAGTACRTGLDLYKYGVEIYIYDPIPVCWEPPQCPPAPSNFSPAVTGMGAVPAPGGAGCGNIRGSGGGGAWYPLPYTTHGSPGAYLVKAFSNAGPIPFSGLTDAAGYFYIPLIPEGEPFTAIAFDTVNGGVRTVEGVGPPVGDSTFLFFNFAEPQEIGTQIEIGDVISGTIGPDDVIYYQFEAVAGQRIYVDRQDATGWAGSRTVELWDPTGAVMFTSSVCSGSCVDIGIFELPLDGLYTLVIGIGDIPPPGDGTFQLQLWDVPDPDEFAIAIGDTVSNGSPGPGAGNIETPGVSDEYTFTVAAGEDVVIDILSSSSSLHNHDLRLFDPNGVEVLNTTCMVPTHCDSERTTLTLSGVYTIQISHDPPNNDNTGTYSFALLD